MAVRGGWGKWARMGLLVGVGLATGCGVVEAEPSEPPPADDVSHPTPGEPPSTEPPSGDPGAEGGGERPSEPPGKPDPGSGGDTRPGKPRAWWRGSFHAGVSPRGLTVGDFNHDGRVDVAVNAEGRNFTSQYVPRTGEVLLLLNDGRGGLEKVAYQQSVMGASGRIVSGDANGDAHLDLLVGTRSGAQVLLGQGDGSFVERERPLGDGVVASLGFWTGRVGPPSLWVLGFDQHWTAPSGSTGFYLTRSTWYGGLEASSLRLPDGSDAVRYPESSGGAAVADFDEDGFMDVAFHTERIRSGPDMGWHAHVLFGDGAEDRVRPGVTLLESTSFERLIAADFNQDGHADLLALSGSEVRVFLGDGTGLFSAASPLKLEPEVSDIAVAYLNWDGYPDVVALHARAGAVSLLRGRGDGTLELRSRLLVGRAPSAAIVTDLDGDHTPELLVAEADDNTVSVYAIPDKPVLEPLMDSRCPVASVPGGASGLPSMAPLATVETVVGIPAVAAGDFDADGQKDLALALPRRGIRLVLNRGGGRFETRDVAGSHEALSLVAGDFDGDGRTDLAGSLRYVDGPMGSGAEPFVGVLWNDVTEPFESSSSLAGAGRDVLAADFNRDGRVDLAAAIIGRCNGWALSFTNQGQRTFSPDLPRDYNVEPDDRCAGAGNMLAADFNGDGTLDLVHTTLGINLNPTAADGTSLPGYGFERVGPYSGGFLGALDVEGDGVPELIQAGAKGSVVLYPGDGHGALRAPMQCALPAGEKLLAVEDLDSDGIPDLAGTNAEGLVLTVLLGTGGGRWGQPRRYELGEQLSWMGPVDLLGDARPELVVLLRSGRLRVFPTPEP